MDDSKLKYSVRRIIMSKTVAEKWLHNVSKEACTLTVFFSDSGLMERFANKSREKYGKDTQIQEAFDHLIVISSSQEDVEDIRKRAEVKGLETTDL